MFILDTDHISLFQRRHPHVSVRVLATPPLELATTIVIVEEQLHGRLERVRRARTDEEVVRAYQNLLATVLYFHTITVIGFDEQTQVIFQRAYRCRTRRCDGSSTILSGFICFSSLGSGHWC